MRKLFLVYALLFFSVAVFAYPKMDINVQVPMPSIFGVACGKGTAIFALEGESASDSFHFDIEVRGDIVSVGKFSFAWSFMSGAYVRYPDAPNFGSLNLSTGVGCFYNWKDGMRSLTGPCIFLYPVYGIPVYTAGFTPFFKWKASVDVGYNFLLFNFLTVYLYEKNILLWTENKFTCLPDIGIAVGVYIK